MTIRGKLDCIFDINSQVDIERAFNSNEQTQHTFF